MINEVIKRVNEIYVKQKKQCTFLWLTKFFFNHMVNEVFKSINDATQILCYENYLKIE